MLRKSSSPSSFFRRAMKWILTLILFFFASTLLVTVAYRWINPPLTPLMVIRKVTRDSAINYQWRDLDEISHYAVDCAVAAEDNNFLGHNGFDFGAIEKAREEYKSGKRRRGASTISQQTAKNVFLWPKSSWLRKGFEVYFTILIENLWSKERIMEVYLNVIEMGDGIYGIEAAAQTYFHTTAQQLTRRQAALITVCYPNPLKFSPAHPSSYVKKRAQAITSLSKKIGHVKFDEASLQKAEERYQKREEKRKARKK